MDFKDISSSNQKNEMDDISSSSVKKDMNDISSSSIRNDSNDISSSFEVTSFDDISSNDINSDEKVDYSELLEKYEEKEIFSYDNSGNLETAGEENFDLNAFSSTNQELENKKKKEKDGEKKPKKHRFLKIVLTCFLIGVITMSVVVVCFMAYYSSIDITMNDASGQAIESSLDFSATSDLGKSLSYTTTIYVDDGNGGYKEYRRLHGEYNRIWVDYDKVAINKNDPDYKGLDSNKGDGQASTS